MRLAITIWEDFRIAEGFAFESSQVMANARIHALDQVGFDFCLQPQLLRNDSWVRGAIIGGNNQRQGVFTLSQRGFRVCTPR